MNLFKNLALPGWVPLLVHALPLIAVALLIVALGIEHSTAVRVTGQRDRIIRVVDPTGKLTPDQAIVAVQSVVTERDAEKAAHAGTVSNYRLATQKAQTDDLNHARTVEHRDAAISGKVQHDLELQLAAARSDADAYARRLRARDAAPPSACADRGVGGGTGVSRAAEPTPSAADPRAATDLDDARICAANTVLAEGWQDWWRQVSVAPR